MPARVKGNQRNNMIKCTEDHGEGSLWTWQTLRRADRALLQDRAVCHLTGTASDTRLGIPDTDNELRVRAAWCMATS